MSSRVAMPIVVLLAIACSQWREALVEGPVPTAVFEQRRAAGHGIFITEEQIRSSRTASLVTLLRSVAGLPIVCSASSCVVRVSLTARDCPPAFFVNGLPAILSTDLEMPTVGITGIEIYRTAAETPLEFVGRESLCGTIVVWMRAGR